MDHHTLPPSTQSAPIWRMIQQHSRIVMTMVMLPLIILGYGLPYLLTINLPKSARVDVIQERPRALMQVDMSRFFGLTGALRMLHGHDLEIAHNTLDNIQYRHSLRRTKRQIMTRYLVNNYGIDEKNARILVRSAQKAAWANQLDLEFLLAIIFVESTYNPAAKSNKGAIGLMQVTPKWHLDKISQYGDVDVLYDIPTNIEIGTAILVEYLKKEGNIRAALHRYNGSKDDATFKYSNRVFDKYVALKKRTYLENVRLFLNFDIVKSMDACAIGDSDLVLCQRAPETSR